MAHLYHQTEAPWEQESYSAVSLPREVSPPDRHWMNLTSRAPITTSGSGDLSNAENRDAHACIPQSPPPHTHTSRSGHSPPTAFSPGARPTPSLENISSCVFTAVAFCFKLLPDSTQKVNIVTYLRTIRMTRKTQKHLPLTLYSSPSHCTLLSQHL